MDLSGQAMSDPVLYGLVGLFFYQAYVTVRVVLNKSRTPAQKRRQLLLTWLVPFIGAALALAEVTADKSKDTAAR